MVRRIIWLSKMRDASTINMAGDTPKPVAEFYKKNAGKPVLSVLTGNRIRSGNQNNWIHLLFQMIADDLGYADPDDIKEYCKQKFIPMVTEVEKRPIIETDRLEMDEESPPEILKMLVDGEWVRLSTAKLNTVQMVEFETRVRTFFNTEYFMRLEPPDITKKTR